MNIGERIMALRKEKNISQSELAKRLNVSRQAVSKWESSRGYPEIEKILYICNRYGTTMNELFADELPEPQREEQPLPVEEFRDERTLRNVLSDFFSNLSYGHKCMIGGILLALFVLILLTSHHLKGGTDQVMTIVWAAAIVVFAVVEAVTAGLISIWFVAGSLGALVSAFVGASLTVQIVVFLVVSAAALAVTRPLVHKITTAPAIATNADRVLGEIAKVTETIDNENAAGAVYADGKTWTARSVDDTVIPAGSRVRVESMQGVKLLVKPAEK